MGLPIARRLWSSVSRHRMSVGAAVSAGLAPTVGGRIGLPDTANRKPPNVGRLKEPPDRTPRKHEKPLYF